jgi:hypothetical protein
MLGLFLGATAGVGVVFYERQALPSTTDWLLISAIVTPSALFIGLVVALWRIAYVLYETLTGLEIGVERMIRERRRKNRGEPPILLT